MSLGSTKHLKAVGLAGLVPLAAGVQQDETDMQQHEGSRLPHELSRTIAKALTVGEDEGHVHPDCDVSCNGEKYHTDGPPLHGGAEKRVSCWGNFNLVRFRVSLHAHHRGQIQSQQDCLELCTFSDLPLRLMLSVTVCCLVMLMLAVSILVLLYLSLVVMLLLLGVSVGALHRSKNLKTWIAGAVFCPSTPAPVST